MGSHMTRTLFALHVTIIKMTWRWSNDQNRLSWR